MALVVSLLRDVSRDLVLLLRQPGDKAYHLDAVLTQFVARASVGASLHHLWGRCSQSAHRRCAYS